MKTQPQNALNPCVWMQSGVIHRKFCHINYQCTECRFDEALQRVSTENAKLAFLSKKPGGKRGKIVFWKHRLKELPTWKRPCIHHLKKRIEFKSCTNGYRCSDCEFDQYFNDQFCVHAVVKPVNTLEMKGIKIPQGYYFHQGHAWAKIEEDASVRVGVDDFALRILGPLDKIEAPLVGKVVRQGHPDIVLNRKGRTAKVLSPVSGVVTDINPTVREQGNLANKNPYTSGWVMRIHTDALRHDLRKLMIGGETQDFLGQEVDRLYEIIEAKAGPLAADGGYLADDIYGNLPEIGWERLTRLFLRT